MPKHKPAPPAANLPPPTSDQIEQKVCSELSEECNKTQAWIKANQGVRLGNTGGGQIGLGIGEDGRIRVRLDLNSWIVNRGGEKIDIESVDAGNTAGDLIGDVKDAF